VTLLGESAGSASVTYHMLSELSMREFFLYVHVVMRGEYCVSVDEIGMDSISPSG
jgi:hypothetical protein